MLLDSDIFITVIKEEDKLKHASLKILKAVERKKLKPISNVFTHSMFLSVRKVLRE